ncbi:hypothetical protein [Microbacterium sp. SORGH_AS_0344]|uniref:hypothetical protein n=1 Tax=Microbacterium sp. SORGH_AS_0344 TaxID=3041767 RepID=UPI0027D819CC|nr:hypothetical protein [Microbacterium sp. SORGH_AS_0344]
MKLRVIENTGEYRAGAWTTPHEAPTTHVVEARARIFHKGDVVIVVGYERTVARGEGEDRRHGRVLEADEVGPDLSRAIAVVTRAHRAPRRSGPSATDT